MQNKISKSAIIVFLMVLAAALSRLIPHIPNFTPVAAIGLFAASFFQRKIYAYLVPLVAMLISDMFLGFHSTMIWVYGSLAVIVCVGQIMLQKISLFRIFGSALLSSILFFVITNFGVWISYDFYAKTWAGFVECYTLAIPFFTNTLLGDFFYCSVLFGIFALAKKYVPVLALSK